MPETTEELLTVAEAARELRIHPNTLRRLIDMGSLPACRVGRQFRIRRESLDAHLAESENRLASAGGAS